MATAQLQLITKGTSWKLDRHTIAIGMAGIAAARAELARSEPEHESFSIVDTAPVTESAGQATPIRAQGRRRPKPVPAGQVSLLPFISDTLDTAA